MNALDLADDLEGWCDTPLSIKHKDNVFKEHADMLRQQYAEIEALKQSKSESNNKVKTVAEIMSEHCTCYKLGYSQLNNYEKVKK